MKKGKFESLAAVTVASILCMGCISAHASTDSGGTARTAAMGTGGIALCGEPGGAGINPSCAGGLYRNAAWISAAAGIESAQSSFSQEGSGTGSVSKTSISLPSGGFIAGFSPGKDSHDADKNGSCQNAGTDNKDRSQSRILRRLNFGFCWNTRRSSVGSYASRETTGPAFSGLLAEYSNSFSPYDNSFAYLGLQTEAIDGNPDDGYTGIGQNSGSAGSLLQSHQLDLKHSSTDFDFLLAADFNAIVQLGASFSVRYVKASTSSTLCEEAPDPTEFESRFHRLDARQTDRLDAVGIAGKFGMTVKPVPSLALALCIHSPYVCNATFQRQSHMECRYYLDDSYSVLNPPNGRSCDGGRTGIKFTMPLKLGAGISWEYRGFTVSADYLWTDLSGCRFFSDDVGVDFSLQKINDILKGSSPGSHPGSTHILGAGAEYVFRVGNSPHSIAFRTGYRSRTVQLMEKPSVYTQASVTGVTSRAVCLGTGWNKRKLGIDLAAERHFQPSVTIRDIYFGYPSPEVLSSVFTENKDSPHVNMERALWRIVCTFYIKF